MQFATTPRPTPGARVVARLAIASAATLAAAAAPARAVVVISDGVFAPADWTHSILVSTPSATLGPMTQMLTGGNPNEYQQGRHVTNGPFASIYDGHYFVGGGTYNPGTQGAITSLDVSDDYIDLAGGSGTQNGMAIKQGSREFIYFVNSSGPFATWTPHGVTGVTGTPGPSWNEVTGGVVTALSAPDFSASGQPMTFGYYTFNWSLPQGFLIDRSWGIDNFSVRINNVPAPDVLALLPFVGLAALRRRR